MCKPKLLAAALSLASSHLAALPQNGNSRHPIGWRLFRVYDLVYTPTFGSWLKLACSAASEYGTSCSPPDKYDSYAVMSKWPWPDNAIMMTRFSPASFTASASSIAARIACADSGAGTMPSVCANCSAASNTRLCAQATASISPSAYSWLTSGESPW